MKIRTITSATGRAQDEAVYKAVEAIGRDPDEVHFSCDKHGFLAVLVWRSASKPALYQPRGEQ